MGGQRLTVNFKSARRKIASRPKPWDILDDESRAAKYCNNEQESAFKKNVSVYCVGVAPQCGLPAVRKSQRGVRKVAVRLHTFVHICIPFNRSLGRPECCSKALRERSGLIRRADLRERRGTLYLDIQSHALDACQTIPGWLGQSKCGEARDAIVQ